MPDLLVEVPHGADRRAHYDALRARLVGELPEDLHIFFHVNTDVGAWSLGRRVAEHLVARRPDLSAMVVRSLIPRTLVDCNRVANRADGGDLRGRGMTAGLPPYVRHPDDVELLLELHAAYVDLAGAAYDTVCGAGGFALNPHTYGPVTLDVARVDENIVSELRRAHQPEVLARAPVRPEIDVISRTEAGVDHAPEGAVDAIRAALPEVQVVEGGTYYLHPATQGYRFATAWPGRVLSLEVRRDLLVEAWLPFQEQTIDDAAVERLAGPLAGVAAGWFG